MPEPTRWPSLTRELGRARVCPIQDPNNEPCWPGACSALCLGRGLIPSPTHLTGKPSRSSGYLHSPRCDPAHSRTCSERLPVDTARTPAQQSRELGSRFFWFPNKSLASRGPAWWPLAHGQGNQPAEEPSAHLAGEPHQGMWGNPTAQCTVVLEPLPSRLQRQTGGLPSQGIRCAVPPDLGPQTMSYAGPGASLAASPDPLGQYPTYC